MKRLVEVSLGELVDKISILRIKKMNIKDTSKLEFIIHEEKVLTEALDREKLNGIDELLQELIVVNSELWQIEDDIRDCEREKKFDQSFIELARAVYRVNDKRFEIKNKINQKYNSDIQEVKSYQKY